MKKRKILLILTASIFVCSLLLFSACVATKKLAVPNFLGLDENNVISWNEVDLARGYKLSIESDKGEKSETVTENTSYSLDALAEGNYYIRIKAVGNGRDIKDSDWSAAKDFQKGYTTGLVYELIQNETAYAIVNVGRASGEVAIEDTYRDDKPVIAIGDRAFKNNKKVTKLTLGANIVSVGKEAFYGCSALREIILPEGVSSMGEAAFQNCSALKSIKLPSTLSAVPSYAFAYCRNMETVEFCVNKVVPEDENTWSGAMTIGSSAFIDCRSIKELILPDTLTGIESGAFMQMAELTRVVINDKVSYINSEAFSSDSKLSEVVIGENSRIDYIGKNAFLGCFMLPSIYLPGKLDEIGPMAFYNCSSLDNIKIPDSVVNIGADAFKNTKEYNEQTKVANAPESTKKNFKFIDRWLVEYIGNKDTLVNFNTSYPNYQPERDGKKGIVGIAANCFYNCGKLANVVIPESVRYLSSYAFASCSALSNLSFENGSDIKVIGSACFMSDAIESVALPEGLERIKSYAFYMCAKLDKVVISGSSASTANAIPASVTTIGKGAFDNTKIWSDALSESDRMVRIGNWAVGYNSSQDGLKDMTIDFGEGETSFGTYRPAIEHVADYAFSSAAIAGAKGTLNLKSIGVGAFYKCSLLDSKGENLFQLNNAFEEIKQYTFYGCKLFRNISINGSEFGAGLKTIGAYAFYNSGLTTAFDTTPGVINLSVTNVTAVSAYAFAFTSASEIKLAANSGKSAVERIGSYAFYNMKNLESVSIPSSVKSVGAFAFFQCDKLSSLTISEGVEYIYQRAFYGCDSLKTITFPASLVYIGAGAFYRCYDLQKVEFVTEEIPDDEGGGVKGVRIIDSYAFYDDEKLSLIELPASLTYIGKYAFFGLDGLGSAILPDSVQTTGQHLFYGVDLTVYAEAEKRPDGWSAKWNSLMRPVVWGSVLSADKSYVVSLTITENTFEYTDNFRSLSAPRRAGYVFAGWSTSEDGEVVYDETSVVNAPVGTTLYTVWTDAEWNISYANGEISSIVVGSGEVPDGVLFDTEIFPGNAKRKVNSFDGRQLYGWSYTKGGDVIFIGAEDNDWYIYVAPGTTLYAVYGDYTAYGSDWVDYRERQGKPTKNEEFGF